MNIGAELVEFDKGSAVGEHCESVSVTHMSDGIARLRAFETRVRKHEERLKQLEEANVETSPNRAQRNGQNDELHNPSSGFYCSIRPSGMRFERAKGNLRLSKGSLQAISGRS